MIPVASVAGRDLDYMHENALKLRKREDDDSLLNGTGQGWISSECLEGFALIDRNQRSEGLSTWSAANAPGKSTMIVTSFISNCPNF
jgi:hypothetical protein